MPLQTSPLTKQQQNALLIRPIIEVESDKGRIFNDLDIDLASLDTQYLALQIIDYIAERNATGEGASRSDIMMYCSQAVRDMAPKSSDETIGKVIIKTLDRLVNASQKRSKFVFTYFNGEEKRMKEHAFWLVEYKQLNVNEPFTYSVTPSAITLFSSMLTVDLMLQQEAQEAMIARLIEKGRIEESVMLAQSARQASRDLSFFFRQKILLIQRNPRCTGWLDDVNQYIDKAREHISGRLSEEMYLLQKIKTIMETSAQDKLPRLIELQEILSECRNRHLTLFESVLQSRKIFHNQQLIALHTPRPALLPDLETEILPQLMTRPLKDIFKMAEDINPAFSVVTTPKYLDLLSVFEAMSETRKRNTDIALQDDELEDVDIESLYRDRFSFEQQNQIHQKIKILVESGRAHDTKGILATLEADGDGITNDDALCVIFNISCAYSDQKIFNRPVDPDGKKFTHRTAFGDNLVFQQTLSAQETKEHP